MGLHDGTTRNATIIKKPSRHWSEWASSKTILGQTFSNLLAPDLQRATVRFGKRKAPTEAGPLYPLPRGYLGADEMLRHAGCGTYLHVCQYMAVHVRTSRNFWFASVSCTWKSKAPDVGLWLLAGLCKSLGTKLEPWQNGGAKALLYLLCRQKATVSLLYSWPSSFILFCRYDTVDQMDFVIELYLLSHIHKSSYSCIHSQHCHCFTSDNRSSLIWFGWLAGLASTWSTRTTLLQHVYARTRVFKGSTILFQATFGEPPKCLVCSFWCLIFKISKLLSGCLQPHKPGWTLDIMYMISI